MKLYVQYTEDGSISGTNFTSGEKPPHPRQLEFVIGPTESVPVTDGMRVDTKTKKLVLCPIIAKERHNAGVHRQLRTIDDATVRALREFYLTGDKSVLQNLEDRAAALRPQLQK